MTQETELWIWGITIAAAVVPWAFSLHAKVAVIAHSVETLPTMFRELKDQLSEHEARLDQHDERIATLQAAPRAGR